MERLRQPISLSSAICAKLINGERRRHIKIQPNATSHLIINSIRSKLIDMSTHVAHHRDSIYHLAQFGEEGENLKDEKKSMSSTYLQENMRVRIYLRISPYYSFEILL